MVRSNASPTPTLHAEGRYKILLLHGERLVRVEGATKGQVERLTRIEAKLDTPLPAKAA